MQLLTVYLDAIETGDTMSPKRRSSLSLIFTCLSVNDRGQIQPVLKAMFERLFCNHSSITPSNLFQITCEW